MGRPPGGRAGCARHCLLGLGFWCFHLFVAQKHRQGGIIFGGVLTVTGMVGMMDVFTGSPGDPRFGFWPLITPQGWASRGLLASMNGAAVSQVLPYVLALVAMSIIFFIIGVLRFQKRYA